MIRIVPTGDLGFDVLLGGGWRLVRRFEERESATVVVRGGSGSGKTLMGIQVALELARALGGDVAVGCVEILPTEYIAQLQSVRPALNAGHVAMLPARAQAGDGPRVYVSLLPDLDAEQHDLVASMEKLDAAAVAAGGTPKVFVVDSLIQLILQEHGWTFTRGRRGPNVEFNHASLLHWGPMQSAFTFVTSNDVSVARSLALSLQPVRTKPELDLVIEIEPLAHWTEELTSATFHVHYLPIALGASRALRSLVERFGRTFVGAVPNIRRLLIGDLGQVLATEDALVWVEALRVFVTLVIESGWHIPIIAYDGHRAETAPRSILLGYADLSVDVDTLPDYPMMTTTQRWPRTSKRETVEVDSLKNYADLGPLQLLTREGSPEVW